MIYNPDDPHEHDEHDKHERKHEPDPGQSSLSLGGTADLFGGGTNEKVETPPGELGEDFDREPLRTAEIKYEQLSRLSEAEFRGLLRNLRLEQKITAEAALFAVATVNVRLERIEKLLEKYRPIHPVEMLELVKAIYVLEHGEELDDVLMKRGLEPLRMGTLEKYVPTGQHTAENMEKISNRVDANRAASTGDRNIAPSCPICGALMEQRSGKFGRFWGCSMYRETKCKGSIDIDPKPWAAKSAAAASSSDTFEGTPFDDPPAPTEPSPDGGEFVEF